jgi:hypothetical protein
LAEESCEYESSSIVQHLQLLKELWLWRRGRRLAVADAEAGDHCLLICGSVRLHDSLALTEHDSDTDAAQRAEQNANNDNRRHEHQVLARVRVVVGVSHERLALRLSAPGDLHARVDGDLDLLVRDGDRRGGARCQAFDAPNQRPEARAGLGGVAGSIAVALGVGASATVHAIIELVEARSCASESDDRSVLGKGNAGDDCAKAGILAVSRPSKSDRERERTSKCNKGCNHRLKVWETLSLLLELSLTTYSPN